MPTTSEVPQEELLRDTKSQLARINEEARGLAGQLSPAQLHWTPPDGGWSIAQVFEHLAASNESYLVRIPEAIQRAQAAGAGRQSAIWKPSFFGKLLIRSLDPTATRSVPAPRIWRPTQAQRANSLERFLQFQDQLAALIPAVAEMDLVRTRVTSPASRFVRVNLGDVFRILVVHGQRHLGQVRRLLAAEGFPK